MRNYKEKGRLVFKFYKSYFDVFDNLETDKDRVMFIKALCERQFFGKEPEGLSKMALFAYTSQKYNIDLQVEGFENKTKLILNELKDPIQGGSEPPIEPPSIETESETESEPKTKTESKIEIPPLEEFIKHALGKKPNLDIEHLKLKYFAWLEAGWVNGNGKKIKNWKSNLNNTIPYISESKNAKQIKKPIVEDGNEW